MSAPSNLVEVTGLTIARPLANGGTARVIDDVSLDLSPGKTLGIAGESGCGKSTLVLAMSGIVRTGLNLVAGRCRFESTDMFQAGERQLDRIRGRQIAMIPQNAGTALTPTIRIAGQIDEALKLHSALDAAGRRDRIEELLGRVRLPEPKTIGRRFPHELSGGQLQRVAIAMALSCEPSLLLLDEPTTGLDVTTQLSILELLDELRREKNLAMVCVSHDLGVLARLCDRLLVMYAGRVVEDRPMAAFIARPAHPYSRALLSSIPRLSARTIPNAIPGRLPAQGDGVGGCSFAPRCPKASGICQTDRPQLRALDGAGQVACHDPDSDVLGDSAIDAGPSHDGSRDDDPVISVTGLAITYGRRGLASVLAGRPAPAPTVKDVSFELRRGEILGLVGESGSGKSTILRVLAGLWPASSGELMLDGKTDLNVPATRRQRESQRRVQLVFQNPDASLNPRHTIRDILAQPLRLYFDANGREVDRRGGELLAEVRLDPGYLDRYPAQLSGGERQRVALARAFAAKPEAILCDEVTSALDVSVQASILRLIANLCQSHGVACIFVSHDLAVVHALARRIAVLQGGRLIEIGPADKICGDPEHAYTKSLIAAALDPFGGSRAGVQALSAPHRRQPGL